jgi:hypothetical protein
MRAIPKTWQEAEKLWASTLTERPDFPVFLAVSSWKEADSAPL